MKRTLLWLLEIYQRFFSIISPGSCRYYPTCSEYARWRVENEPWYKAAVSTAFRILRCNQLFEGGIEYPVVKKELKRKSYGKIAVKYWLVPKGKNLYYVIKDFNFSGKKGRDV